jgi:ADP-ribose pyrophosphatase YjhB (NUDIX family)
MTDPSSPPAVRVVARAGERQVADFVLEHGADPVRQLAALGWSARRLAAADLGVEGVLELRYAVEPATPVAVVHREVPTDPGLVRAEDEPAYPYQRTAAYGVVTSERGLLLTELSETTSAPGRWTLPGGGLDPGEQPEAGLHREIWEESGQRVERVRLLEVQTSHWIGRAPGGRLEDFHAVRIVYAAWCPTPTAPEVHDVGGSTASVRWVPLGEVGGYPLGRSFAPHLARWLSSG